MNRHVSVLSLLALGVLALGACSSSTQGNAAPATSATTAQQGSGGTSTSAAASDPLAATDPCTLLDSAVVSQNQLSQGAPGTGPGVRYCRWQKAPDSGSVGYGIQIGIYDHAGLDGLSTAGFTVTNDPVGRHQGRLSKDTAGGNCNVSLEVATTSRVDVIGTDGAGKLDAACVIATQIAPVVERKLPAGSG